MIICQICKRECNGIGGLSRHLKIHKTSVKDYYDKYLKKENEGSCLTCGKETNFAGLRHGYCRFCSHSCVLNNKDIQHNMSIACLKKYGVTNAMKSDQMIEKRKLTYIKNFGITHPMKSDKILKKRNKTNWKKYGIEYQHSQKEYYDKFIKKNEQEGVCLTCGKETNFNGLKKGYSQYYSLKCSNNSPQVKEKKRLKSQEHYGTDFPMQSRKVQKIGIQTNLKRRGIDNIFKDTEYIKKCIFKKFGGRHSSQTKEVQEKIKQTCLKKYGVENPNQSEEIKEKIKQTFLQKYGETSNLKCKDIKEKIKQTCMKKYGAENPFQSKEVQEKIKQTNLEKYGVENPSQSKEIQDKIKQIKIKNGTQISDDQLSYFRIYSREVLYFTNLSIKKKYNKEELEKRKLNGTDGGLQADHKFSIIEGFKQKILPCIIGSQCNLELLPWLDNCKKNKKCSITKEELFQLYEQELKK